uniref:F-box domain-containing protein n=1 Tax=Caenorhabditis tropicalis TaxID=1561998 RepID=A0A1I7TF04_9PELO
MARKTTTVRKTETKESNESKYSGKYSFVSLSDINGILILKTREDEKNAVYHRVNSKCEKDTRSVLKTFFELLDGNEIEQLRLFGIRYQFFSLVKFKKNTEFSISSIVFDRSTNLNVLFDLLPHSKGLKHVTFRGCTKHPYEKRYYAARVHYSEVNPFDTLDFVHLQESFFTENPEDKEDPKFLPSKLLLKPYRYDTEIFIRYYLTPKRLAELIASIASEGGFFVRGEWMVYKMIQNKQFLCKCGINGVYCVVIPAGCNTINPTSLEKFVWNSNSDDAGELLSEPEEINERRGIRLEWNSLTNDIKQKCIEKMDFKTRIGLRSTCRAERNLVDSSKRYAFKFVKVEHLTYSDDTQTISVVAQNSSEIINVRSERWIEHGKGDDNSSFELTVSAIKSILKFCDINALFLYPGAREEGMDYLQKELADAGPFRISTFSSIILNPTVQLAILRYCNVPMDMISLRITKTFSPKKYFDVPQFTNSKCVQVYLDKFGHDSSKFLFLLVEKWIEINPDVGKKAVFGFLNQTFASELRRFAAILGSRVISQTDELVLLRTDDDTKRILVHIYYEMDDNTYVNCRVISSDTNEADFELFDSPWIGDELIYEFEEIDEEDDTDDDKLFE